MTKSEVVVETVHSMSPSGERPVSAAKPTTSFATVNLVGGRSAKLDTSMPHAQAWANILDSVQRAKQAVYLKIDPRTGMIADLLLPLAVKVASMKSANRAGDVEVELVISAARHYLRRANPDYEGMLKILKDALKTGIPVLVTESRDRQEIVDVRPLPETVAAPGYLAAPLVRPTAEKPRAVPKQEQSQSEKGGVK